MSTILSLWTVAVFVIFIGVVIWTLNPKRKKEFEEAAMLPFADDEMEKNTEKNLDAENNHG